VTNNIARAPMSGKVYPKLAGDRDKADQILANEARQLRIETVNLCDSEQNFELLVELEQCVNFMEQITVLTKWKNRLEELARLRNVERLAREFVQAVKAWQASPTCEVGAWVRQARMDLEKIL
jgi:hypothetical protein